MSCGERVAGDTRGLVGAMTLTSTQTELVPTVRTSAVTSLSAAQQDRGCTPLSSSSEADRSHALVVELKTSSVLLTNERAVDTSEVCSSASLSFHLWRSPPALSLIRPLHPCRAQVGLSNIFPLISDAADSNAATSNTPAVRARALFTPPALAMSLSSRGRSASSRRTRYPSPRTLSSPQVVSRLRHDAPEFVPPLLKAPASCPDAPEIAPSATRSAPNEADLLPALDSGREKLLSSTESEDALKESKLARTLAIILYLRLSSYRCSRQMLPPSEALPPAPF